MTNDFFAFAFGCSGQPARARAELRYGDAGHCSDRADRRSDGDGQPTRRRSAGGRPKHDAADQTGSHDSGAIVVTGFRAALQNAVNTKKRSEQIIESVTAEDIGKLPDASIARIDCPPSGPDVATRFRAAANVISIRGFWSGLLDHLAERPRADVDQRQPRRRISTNIRRKSSTRSTSTRRRCREPHRPGPCRHRRPAHVRPLDAGKRIIAVGARGSLQRPREAQPGCRQLRAIA